jgi:1-acyl-sn-glycerol-3-phosphate acyltransferase
MIAWLVNHVIKLILHIILKLDTSELKKIPKKGAFLVVVNHINFLDTPVVVTHLPPNRITGLIKKETWEEPVMAFLFNIWGGIPIEREKADFGAFKNAKKELEKGKILAIAPEGTRTEDGRLIQGKPGVALFSRKFDVPIIPIAFYGNEAFKKNFRKLKRTPMKVHVGQPFRVCLEKDQRDKEVLQEVADSIMMEIAALMPEKYHGYYQKGKFVRGKFIEYLDDITGEHIPQTFRQKPTQTKISS